MSTNCKKTAILTGAAGFTGINLVETLIKHEYKVIALVRPGSLHNKRLNGFPNVEIYELNTMDIGGFDHTRIKGDIFFHLAWHGERDDSKEQLKNVEESVELLHLAKKIGCTRFIATGSQAEYGATSNIQYETTTLNPFSAYGDAKVRACDETRRVSSEIGIEWIWGRIFSLIGEYEPKNRLFPMMIEALAANKELNVSSCEQNWDYLDVKDAAFALIKLSECGKTGEIYNIASGNYRPLKDFVEEAKQILESSSKIIYGNRVEPFVSLQPAVEKIVIHTGWIPLTPFEESVKAYSLQFY